MPSQGQGLWIVAVIGTGTLAGAFWRMKGGFGAFNLRVIAIILIATLVSILAIVNTQSLNAALGILGAIAGYIFGLRGDAEP
jgi:hypothetical protein